MRSFVLVIPLVLGASVACQPHPQPSPDGGEPDAGVEDPGRDASVVWSSVEHAYTMKRGHCEARWMQDLSPSLGTLGEVVPLDDMTGDGVPDLLVTGSTPSTDGGVPRSRVVVLSGHTGESGGPVRDLRGRPIGVALSGDVDRDGIRDIALAVSESYDACPGGSSGCGAPQPRTHVYALRSSTFEERWSLGPTPSERTLGEGLVGWIDEDGDGIPELLAGSPYPAPGEAGGVRVLSGADGSALRLLQPPDAADAFGTEVLRAPDLDGDGVADLYVGDPLGPADAFAAGAVFALSGRTGAVLWRFKGTASDDPDLLGQPLISIGDVNRDGVPDLLAGAPNHAVDGLGANSGEVVAIDGKTGTALLTMEGRVAGGRFGQVVAAAGDMDRDGVADFAVFLPGTTPTFFEPGRTGRMLIYSGATGEVLVEMESTPPTTSSDRFGASVTGLGDVTGDGRGELMVVSPGALAVGATGTAELVLWSCTP